MTRVGGSHFSPPSSFFFSFLFFFFTYPLTFVFPCLWPFVPFLQTLLLWKVCRPPIRVFTPFSFLDLPLMAMLLMSLFPLASFDVQWQSMLCSSYLSYGLILDVLLGALVSDRWEAMFRQQWW